MQITSRADWLHLEIANERHLLGVNLYRLCKTTVPCISTRGSVYAAARLILYVLSRLLYSFLPFDFMKIQLLVGDGCSISGGTIITRCGSIL